jgi:hypothetical protein
MEEQPVMIRHPSRILAAGLVVFSLGTAAAAPPAGDGRQAIALGPEHQAMVLKEMRTMLESVQGILAGLSAGDREGAAEAASRAGMDMARGMPRALKTNLPAGFRRLGRRTHRGFDELAAAIRQGEGQDMILDRLSDHLTNCTGCHSAYRVTGKE